APAVFGEELHPAGAMPDLTTHHAHDLLRAARLLGALRRIEGVPGAARPVAAGSDDGARDREDARTGHDPLLDGALELDVAVQGAFGAEVAQGGDPRLERGP